MAVSSNGVTYEVVCVHSLDEVYQAIREHELSKSTKYVTVKKDKMFGKDDVDLLHSEVRFEDTQKSTVPYISYDGVPFIIVGRKRMACHHGKDTHSKEKERKKGKDHQVGDHDYKKTRKLLQTTKKKDCSAGIRVRHVIRFPDYKVSDCGKRSEKDAASLSIKQKIRTGQIIRKEHTFFVSIPDDSEHENHFMGEDASLIQPIDEDLKKYIGLMVVQHQVGNTFQMKLLLEVYVKQTLFDGQNIPSRLNKRFWPSIKDIKNHMALALLRLRNTNVDQAVVSELVTKWELENPKDNFYIRVKKDNDDEFNQDIPLCPENDDAGDDNGEDLMLDDETLRSVSVTEEKFLFIHQSDFQKQLLLKYGQEICLMDATYRTTQYAVPLYFICVPTNVNYMTVATFITETEDSDSIKRVLLQLRQWNPEWNPSFFMCDYATEEINAIESVFPDSFVYLCDFHREQAWDRWLNASHNGVQLYKSQILSLLRNIATASTEMEFEEAKDNLKESALWRGNKKFRDWFERYWLSKSDRWVQAYRQNRFNVSINTNNGIERQNLALKYEYLQSKKASSLSHLLTIIVESFNFWTYRKYRKMNIQASDQARKYASDIPEFLTNRPPHVVKHCFVRWQEAINIPSEDIDVVDDINGTFLVKSQTSDNTLLHYLIKFQQDDIGLPSCDCLDWKKSHLPCKHFFAIFQNFDIWSWESLPILYRKSPFLNLDIQLENVDNRQFFEETVDAELADSEAYLSTADFIELPISSAASIKRKKQKIQSICNLIKDLCYKVEDSEVLNSTIDQLNSVRLQMNSSVPQTAEFLLDKEEMLHIGTSKKTIKCRNLKKTKAKKKGVGRVGRKATRQKEGHTKLGVNDLIKKNEELFERNTSESTAHVIESVVNEDFVIYEATAISEESEVRTPDEGVSTGQNLDTVENTIPEGHHLNILQKFKAFMSSIDTTHWFNLIDIAQNTYNHTLDMTSQIGFSVLFDVCNDSTDLVAEMMIQMTYLMPTTLPKEIKDRMINIILEQMVTKEIITLTVENDPRVKAMERTKAMEELINDPVFKSLKATKGIASSVDVSKGRPILKASDTEYQHINRKRKLQFATGTKSAKEIKISCVYPSGGLLNSKGANICFANALLQCVRLTDMHRILQLHDNCSDDRCFTCNFKEFIEEGPATAAPLIRQLNTVWHEYRFGKQQDAHEFFVKLMQEVWSTCIDTNQDCGVRNIFYGIQKSTVVCDTCGSVSSKEDVYSDISISIEEVQTVSQAVEEYFAAVPVEYNCLVCKSKNGSAKKMTTLDSIPKNIVIHLKRFNGTLRKVSKKVDVSFDLHLRNHVSNGKELEDKAQLFGVIFHAGRSASNGHYYSFVKFGQHWFKIDDMKITSITELSFQNCKDQEYILFYRTLPRPYIS